MQLKFEIVEKTSKHYNYSEFVNVVKEAINFAKKMASEGKNIDKVAISWDKPTITKNKKKISLRDLIGASKIKVHTFTAHKKEIFFDNGKTLKDIENEFNVRFSEDRDNHRLNIKPLDL